MPRKPNYAFEKRQKDLARQKKKEEKLQKKALRKTEDGDETEVETPQTEHPAPDDASQE